MGRKATAASTKKGKKKSGASDSSQLKVKETSIPPVSIPAEPSSTKTVSNTSPPTETKHLSPKSSSSTKSPPSQPSTKAPLPKSPEVEETNVKEPVSSLGEQPRSTEEFFDTEGGKEEEEILSGEEELKIIGSTEKTPKPLARSRATRSSLRRIKEEVLEEQSTNSAAGSKRKRGTARKTTRGMSLESPSGGSTDLSSRVVLSGCKTGDGYFDERALSEVKELLEYQGWMSLFNVCDANTAGVRSFFMNLKQLPDMSLSSLVNGVEVSMSVASLSVLLNVPRDGFDKFSGDGWPILIGITPDDIHDFVFGGKVPRKSGTFKTVNLKEPVMLVLHSICNKMLLPRAQGRGMVRIMEMVLIYLIMKKIKVNLPSLMIDHIMYSYNSSHHSLPYGSYITKLLKENNVSLSGSTVPVVVFTKAILKQKGLDISSGELRFRDEEPVEETPRLAKKKKEEPAGQTVLLQRLEAQEEMLQKLMGLVEGLSASFTIRMSAVEKQVAGSSKEPVPVEAQAAEEPTAEESEDEAEEDQDATADPEKSEEDDEEEENDDDE